MLRWPNLHPPLSVIDSKFLVALSLLTLWLATAALQAQARVPNPDELREMIFAESALLYDPATGTILYERNIDRPLPPASTTKLMTALLVYEMKGLRGSVMIEPEDTRVEPSSVPLIAGETVSIDTLMHALLIASDNDAALTLARYVAGSEARFIDMMNARARALGCQNTHFANPNGLPARNHYTTARDLRRIFNLVIAIPVLRQMCETREYTLSTRAGVRVLINHNKLLGKYPGMGPAKTGWTIASQHTYAAAATRDGRELQLIILHSQDKWRDATHLFDFGFAHLPPLQAAPLRTAGGHPTQSPQPTSG